MVCGATSLQSAIRVSRGSVAHLRNAGYRARAPHQEGVSIRLEDGLFVTVIHHINDPEGFQAAEAKALEAGLPSHVALPIHAATDDHALGICIWEGESVDAVREVVEGAVGPWAKNEYFEMHVDGLTPQLGT